MSDQEKHQFLISGNIEPGGLGLLTDTMNDVPVGVRMPADAAGGVQPVETEDLKRKLGQTPLNHLKMNLSKILHEVQMSTTRKPRRPCLWPIRRPMPTGYSIPHFISLPAMRNSPTFKSFEERAGGSVSEEYGSQNLHSLDNNPQDTATF
ncbi:LOW QUALITY PROTEIN: tumor protein D53-like [Discoglossus pictus]